MYRQHSAYLSGYPALSGDQRGTSRGQNVYDTIEGCDTRAKKIQLQATLRRELRDLMKDVEEEEAELGPEEPEREDLKTLRI